MGSMVNALWGAWALCGVMLVSRPCLADACEDGERPSRGHCCASGAMWDARYQHCASEVRERCTADQAPFCVVAGDHYTDPTSREYRPEFALPYYRKACTQGEPAGCVGLAHLAMRDPGESERARAERLFAGACERGFAPGCTGLAEWIHRYRPDDRVRVEELLAQACQARHMRACAVLALWGERAEDAFALAAQACTAGDPLGCSVQAHLSAQASSEVAVGEDPVATWKATEAVHTTACMAGEPIACMLLGEHCLLPSPDRAAQCARPAFLRGCEGGVGESCRRLAELFERGEAGPVDSSEATRLLEEGCQARDLLSCQTIVGRSYAYDAFFPRAPGHTALAIGCELGDAALCQRLTIANARYGHERDSPSQAPRSVVSQAPEFSPDSTQDEGVEAGADMVSSLEIGYGGKRGGRVARMLLSQGLRVHGMQLSLWVPAVFADQHRITTEQRTTMFGTSTESTSLGSAFFLLGNLTLRGEAPAFERGRVRLRIHFGVSLPTASRTEEAGSEELPDAVAARDAAYWSASALGGFENHSLWYPNGLSFPTGAIALVDLEQASIEAELGMTTVWDTVREEPHLFGQAALGLYRRLWGLDVGVRALLTGLTLDERARFALQPTLALRTERGPSMVLRVNWNAGSMESPRGTTTPKVAFLAGLDGTL